MATYKGPDGRLYRVSEAPGIRGTYRIEYLDPACSVVYKQLPGYNDNANREEVVALLDKLAKDRGLVQAVVEDSPIPAWAVDIAKEFVASKWVRELESFSAACLQASSEAESHAGGTCGPGFADASPKGIKLWRPGAGEITYTWAKFVQACKEMGIQPAPEEATADPAADPCATCLCNTCADDNCDNAPGCYKDKDACAQTHNTAKCDDYRPKGAPEPATAEPQEIADESSDQDTPGATLTAAPATEIATPAFDFAALGELAEQAAEDDQEFDFHAARSREEYGFACVYLARVHDLTARAGRYGGGTWTKWCEAKGLSEGTAKRMLEIGDSFKSAKLADLKNLAVFGKGELRAIATSGNEEIKEAAVAGDTERVEELLAQLKAAEAAREAAEKKAQGLKASYNTAHANEQYNIDLRKKAQEAVEDLKQKLYRRNEELAKKEQALNVTMDQQGVYIAKMQEQEDMLADLQDRLDDTTAQLRSRPVPAEVVDQDEIERRAAELAAQKIAEAEARAAEAERSLCDVAILLKGTIDQAWQASGIDGLTPRSQDDDAALESLHQDLLAHVDALEVTMAPDCQDWEGEDE